MPQQRNIIWSSDYLVLIHIYIYVHKYIYHISLYIYIIYIYLTIINLQWHGRRLRKKTGHPLWCSTLGRCTPRCAPVTSQRPCRPSTLRAVRCRCGWWCGLVGWLVGCLVGATARAGQTYYEKKEIWKNFGRFFVNIYGYVLIARKDWIEFCEGMKVLFIFPKFPNDHGFCMLLPTASNWSNWVDQKCGVYYTVTPFEGLGCNMKTENPTKITIGGYLKVKIDGTDTEMVG